MQLLSIPQMLRALWVRAWLIVLCGVLLAPPGVYFFWSQPPVYTAQSVVLHDARPDPLLGVLGAPVSLAMQREVIESDVVARRALEILGRDRFHQVVADWDAAPQPKPSLERLLLNVTRGGLRVENSRGGHSLVVMYTSRDPVLAADAANAYVRAAMEVGTDMRVDPARESAGRLEQQSTVLRGQLEAAQARLTEFARSRNIALTDDTVDEETARLAALTAQLATAQAESADARSRASASAGAQSTLVMQDPEVVTARERLAAAETRLTEMSRSLGANHPQRIQQQTQVEQLRSQLNQAIARASRSASASSAASTRASAQRVAELTALVEAQRKRLIGLRDERDQLAVLQRDVEAARRAYEGVTMQGEQAQLAGGTAASMLRVLSYAEPPQWPSRKRKLLGMMASVAGAFGLGMGLAILWEMLSQRTRTLDDLLGDHGVPVIGVLRSGQSRQPVFRQLASSAPMNRPALPYSGASG